MMGEFQELQIVLPGGRTSPAFQIGGVGRASTGLKHQRTQFQSEIPAPCPGTAGDRFGGRGHSRLDHVPPDEDHLAVFIHLCATCRKQASRLGQKDFDPQLLPTCATPFRACRRSDPRETPPFAGTGSAIGDNSRRDWVRARPRPRVRAVACHAQGFARSSSAPHRLALRIIWRWGDHPCGAFDAHHMHRQFRTRRGLVAVDQGHGQRFARVVAITARGDETNAVLARPDGFIAAGIGIQSVHLQRHLNLRRAVAIAFGQGSVFADKVLVPVDPAIHPGHAGVYRPG